MPHIKLKDILLEMMVKESPDSGLAFVPPEELARVAGMGYDIPIDGNALGYDDSDCVTFVIDKKSGDVLYTLQSEDDRQYHAFFKNFILVATSNNIVKTPNGGYGISNKKNIESEDYVPPAKGIIHMLDAHSKTDAELKFEKYKALWQKIGALGDARTAFGLSGRLWINSKFISFWGSKEEFNITKNREAVGRLLKHFGIDGKRSVYQFIDSRSILFTYEKMNSDIDKKLSDAEIAILLQKQHLDPAAKRKLAQMDAGTDGPKQKVASGYDFQAKRNYANAGD